MPNNGIRIEPLTRHIGAEIHGLDLRQPLTGESFEIVHRALLDNLVVFFRDQELTHDQHVAMGSQFGELHIHPSAPCVDDRPELMKIHADDTTPFAEGTHWHSDVSCDAQPPMGSILRLTSVPEVGGDTIFASMYAAYDALSDSLKAFLDPLTALHTGRIYEGRYEPIGGGPRREFEENEHPVIRTHPETGRKAVYVSAPFTDHIVGLKSSESDVILKFLYQHCANTEFQCRFKWEENSVAFWDNRCVQHLATWDYYPQTRSGVRVTIKGDTPFH